MLFCQTILPQSSFGLTGSWPSNDRSRSFLNSFENNPTNFSLLKDWGLSFSYGGEFSSSTNSSLYLLSLSKKINRSLISLRYTPGYQKDFIFKTGESIINEDSTLQSLESRYSYKELFGLGYSYKVNDNLSVGFSLRYFNQEFNNEEVSAIFLDTLYLSSSSQTESLNSWRGDIGLNYSLNENISFSAATVNLFNISESPVSDENKKYEMKKSKKGIFGFSYLPLDLFGFNVLYETDNSFQAGINSSFPVFDGSFALAVSAFHDKYQSPFIAGIVPAISYTSKYFGVTVSGVKYLSERDRVGGSISGFTSEGISNIINNKYSFDKAVLTISFTLNTVEEKIVEFLGVEILNEIYPALSGNYPEHPFAVGKVVNLTAKPVTIKPESRIEGVTAGRIQSPEVTIAPFDTANVSFYTIIPENYTKDKAVVSFADFFITTVNENPDDQFQNPVLVNGINGWDGNVVNLKNFIKRDMNFSLGYTKSILSEYKPLLDTISYSLFPFYKTKIIYDKLVKNLVYTADPRASSEYVQFPEETIKLKGGDCDDLSVCLSGLLESAGIETALVDYKNTDGIRHVNILVNTELSPAQARIITMNDNKYFIRKNERGIDEIWIPVEATTLTNFEDAWNNGVEKFNKDALDNYGLVKGTVEIIDVE